MSRTHSDPVRLAIGLGARAAAVTGAYVLAGLAILLTVIGLRGAIGPAELRAVLAFIFIATLSSGLEPATVKTAALREGGAEATAAGTYLVVAALKGVLVSPVLAVVWRFADPSATRVELAWLPLVAVAGFGATDLRVLLDLRGRHALAIGLKQGSLAGGVALLGALVALGAPLAWTIGLSTLGRLAILAIVVLAAGGRGSFAGAWTDARRLLLDWRWIELAAISVIAAASGSIDRLVGLRLLSPGDYGGYYLTYEILSKFWLLPYLLGPIVFARQAAGETGPAFARLARRLTAVAGAAFLATLYGLVALAPGLVARVVGASFGAATLAFALAVVISAFVQLRIAHLQGAGRARVAVVAMGLAAGLTAPLFYVAAIAFGAPGLLWAFLGKVLLEGAALLAADRWPRGFWPRRTRRHGR